MRIGLDLDGCLYNFEDSVRQYLAGHGYPRELMPDPERWSFHEDWGLTLEAFKTTCNRGVNDGVIFNYGRPYDGVTESVQRIRDAGHTIHVITARFYGEPGVAQMLTVSWLARYSIPFDTITFSHDKTVVPTDFMIEDNIRNYDALEEAGTCAVLMDRAWNRGTPEDYRRLRAFDMPHFADMIEEAS